MWRGRSWLSSQAVGNSQAFWSCRVKKKSLAARLANQSHFPGGKQEETCGCSNRNSPIVRCPPPIQPRGLLAAFGTWWIPEPEGFHRSCITGRNGDKPGIPSSIHDHDAAVLSSAVSIFSFIKSILSFPGLTPSPLCPHVKRFFICHPSGGPPCGLFRVCRQGYSRGPSGEGAPQAALLARLSYFSHS